MTLRSIVIVLLLLLGILQYKLWISGGGIRETIELHHAIAKQTQANQKIVVRNKVLSTQVQELKQGKATVIDLARDEIGMIKSNETYYQFVH